jgi:hypothetical protein
MTSSAISAQGSTLGIASATAPAAVNLSSITATVTSSGTTTSVATASPHGLANGAQVTFSGVTGADAALLNGQTYAVSVVSPTSFTIQLNSYGKTLTGTSASITGTAYLGVSNWRTFNGLDGQASEIDVTNLSSVAKEIRLGLVDFGQLQLECDHNLADAGQARVQTQYMAGALTPFILSLPNGNTASFNAFVRKFSLQGGVDQVVKRQIDLRISGPVTWC